ncbi:MAG: MerR family transcriptional regulator [Treponema sp.]|nr:MerR family transcriptional regulator [Treponema sp.]
MRSYSIGQVERILGEKAHVIRYWERAVPLVSPRRSESGRREYSEAELLSLLRMKHLVRSKGLSPEAAREVLLREATGPRQDLRARAYEIRALLVRAYFRSLNSLS